jgi:hypothetical protein
MHIQKPCNHSMDTDLYHRIQKYEHRPVSQNTKYEHRPVSQNTEVRTQTCITEYRSMNTDLYHRIQKYEHRPVSQNTEV